MSTYSTTDSNINTPKSSAYLNFQKFTKFNKFYLSKNNFLFKAYQLNKASIKKYTYKNSLMSTNHITPLKITKIDSISNLSNSKYLNIAKSKSYKSFQTTPGKSNNTSSKIKQKFNPDILETQYVSIPKKYKKQIKIDIPRCNTFLGNKIKKRPLNINIIDYINGCNSNIRPKLDNKLFIHQSIKVLSHRNNSISESMKLLINRKNKSSKKIGINLLKYKQKLRCDKRESMNEYNEFMHSLRTNLNKSKSKSYSRNFFYYE